MSPGGFCLHCMFPPPRLFQIGPGESPGLAGSITFSVLEWQDLDLGLLSHGHI